MIREQFWWPGLAKSVFAYCQRCEECARQKADHRRIAGHQVSIPVPDKPWEVLHIDFVSDLPTADAADAHAATTVATVVDRFSKYAVFIPLVQTDAVTFATAFFRSVVCQHGLPRAIISDQDPRFTGQFWRELMQCTALGCRF